MTDNIICLSKNVLITCNYSEKICRPDEGLYLISSHQFYAILYTKYRKKIWQLTLKAKPWMIKNEMMCQESCCKLMICLRNTTKSTARQPKIIGCFAINFLLMSWRPDKNPHQTESSWTSCIWDNICFNIHVSVIFTSTSICTHVGLREKKTAVKRPLNRLVEA